MIDYQIHVADRAKRLIALMEDVSEIDTAVAKLLTAMRCDLERIAEMKEDLPSRILHGWIYYFTYENPERIDQKFPGICMDEAELNWMMGHSSMESFLKSKAFLDSL